jgi:hypothetical protein
MIGAITAGLFSTGTVVSTNSYESIATVALGSSQTTIAFSSIPSTYKHLQIRAFGKTDVAGSGDYFRIRFNSDTATNYSTHFLSGDGSSVPVSGNANVSSMYATRFSGNSGATNIFGAGVVDILDYSDTNKYKTVRTLGGVDTNGGGEVFYSSGSWRSTSAVNAITLFPNAGSNFMQYTSVALYGIKG